MSFVSVPPPLPQMEPDQVKDPVAKKAVEALLDWVTRLRDQLYGNTSSLNSAVGGLSTTVGDLTNRVKDVYVFPKAGAPAVTKPGGLGIALPLRVVATSAVAEVRVDFETPPAKTGARFLLLADGVPIADLPLSRNQAFLSVTTFANAGLTKDQKLQVTCSVADGKDLVVQVRCK